MTDSNTTPVGQTFHIVITCADGLEIPLQTELASFGIDTQIERTGRLMATLTLAQIYQVCLWSRVAVTNYSPSSYSTTQASAQTVPTYFTTKQAPG